MITFPLSLAIASSSRYHSTIYIYCNGFSMLTKDLGLLFVAL
nr:MAG TPA: hypothetical protein [Caudoviricetes sp.]